MKKLLLVLSIFTLIAACKKDYDKIDKEKIEEYVAAKGLKTTALSSGVHFIIEKDGTGEKLKETDEIAVKYKGFLLDDKQFDDGDSSILIIAERIEGWRQALTEFKVGSKGKIIIPSTLGFGSQGAKNFAGVEVVPANAVLIYEIEVIRKNPIFDKNIKEMKAFIKSKGWKVDSLPEHGLYYVIDEPGTGANPAAGSQVTVKYKGYNLDNKVFDQSDNGITFSLTQVIKGWQLGIPLFKKGGKGKLIMPSRLAYYSTGSGTSIPPFAPLVFEVELVNF